MTSCSADLRGAVQACQFQNRRIAKPQVLDRSVERVLRGLFELMIGDEATALMAVRAADEATARSVIAVAAANVVVTISLRDEPTQYPEHLFKRVDTIKDDASVAINLREYMNS